MHKIHIIGASFLLQPVKPKMEHYIYNSTFELLSVIGMYLLVIINSGVIVK